MNGGDISTSSKEDATDLTAVRRRWRECANARCEPPPLNICLYEDKPGLPEVDVDATWTIGTDGGKQVPIRQTRVCIFHLTPILREEHCPRTGTIANAEDVTFLKTGAARSGGEGEVMGLITVRVICDRVPTKSGETEPRVRFRSQANRYVRRLWKVEHLRFPVVDLVKFGQREVRLYRRCRRRVRQESQLRASVDQQRG